MLITSLYAVLLFFILLPLAMRVGILRVKNNISLYDGGNDQLKVAIRQHANFVEQVPFAIILMALVEYNGVWDSVLHFVGISFVVARVLHPFGVVLEKVRTPLRTTGNNLMAVGMFTLVICLIVQLVMSVGS